MITVYVVYITCLVLCLNLAIIIFPIFKDEDSNDSGKISSSTDINIPRGIYIDYIYNPYYKNELDVLKLMLAETIERNNLNYFYDFTESTSSDLITLGTEHGNYESKKRRYFIIKTKLLKDVLYNEDIFKQIYLQMFQFFRKGSSNELDEIPEYDRNINFKRYKMLFSDTRDQMDLKAFSNPICRESVRYFENRICIITDEEYIRENFIYLKTQTNYIKLTQRIAWFMTKILTTDFNFVNTTYVAENVNCYKIVVRPEIDVKEVLLNSHKSVQTSLSDEVLDLDNPNEILSIIKKIIIFKHRILHALGINHRYNSKSIMANFENLFQLENVFNLLQEDWESMNVCYPSFKKPKYLNSLGKEYYKEFVDDDFSSFQQLFY